MSNRWAAVALATPGHNLSCAGPLRPVWLAVLLGAKSAPCWPFLGRILVIVRHCSQPKNIETSNAQRVEPRARFARGDFGKIAPSLVLLLGAKGVPILAQIVEKTVVP